MKSIKIQEICEANNWHLANCITAIATQMNVSQRIAEPFVAFVFSDHATISDSTPEECVTDLEYEIIASHNAEWFLEYSEEQLAAIVEEDKNKYAAIDDATRE